MALANTAGEKRALSVGNPPKYMIADGQVLKCPTGDGEEPKVLCDYLRVAEVRRNVDTQKVTILLEYDYKGSRNTLEVSRGELTRRRVSNLLQYGVDVPDDRASEILRYLEASERDAPLVTSHSHLGWCERDGSLSFRLHRSIGAGDSVYEGDLMLEPSGTYEAWQELVRREVMGSPHLELALVLGLASPVAAMISGQTGLDVIIFHIYGNSSRGKTTALMLATSPFGYPHYSQGNGLIKPWYGTDNAIVAHFRDNYGVPMGLDEASAHSGESFSKLIYALAHGNDKARLDKDGSRKPGHRWSGLILSSAEHSLHDRSSQNIGIRVRLFEVGNEVWTRTAEHADALKTGLLRNYGHAGPVFVERLIHLGRQGVLDRWHNWRREVYERMERRDEFSHRVSDKLAVVVATAELARQALGLPFNVEAILGLLLENDARWVEERNLARNAYEYLVEVATRHHSKFTGGDYERWGRLGKNARVPELYVLPQVFRNIMAEGGFHNYRGILKEWKALGLLICGSGDRLQCQRVIQRGTRRVRVYGIRLLEEYGRFTPDKAPRVGG